MGLVRERTIGSDSDRRSDADLLATTRLEPEAFGVFYHRHFDNIISYFWHRTRDRDVAADLTAETFAAALAGIVRFAPARGSASQWLYGIAANLLKKFWRRQKASDKARRRLEMSTPATPMSGWDSIETADARLDGERLANALERVPVKNRQAVQLRIVEQLEYDQIAERLSCSPGAARVRVLRGLKRLQSEFDQTNASA